MLSPSLLCASIVYVLLQHPLSTLRAREAADVTDRDMLIKKLRAVGFTEDLKAHSKKQLIYMSDGEHTRREDETIAWCNS